VDEYVGVQLREGGMTVTQSITSEVVVGGYDLIFNELL